MLEGRAIVSNKEIPIQKFIPLSNLRKPNVPLPSCTTRGTGAIKMSTTLLEGRRALTRKRPNYRPMEHPLLQNLSRNEDRKSDQVYRRQQAGQLSARADR